MAERKSAASRRNSISSGRPEILISIVNRKKADSFMDLLQSFEVNMQCVALAEGTADAEMLGLLGLTDSEKAVIFSVIREDRAADALHALEEKFKTIRDGKGIAFTISMSSMIGVSVFRFLTNDRMSAENKNKHSQEGAK